MVRYSLILFYFLQLCLRSKIGGKTAPAPWSKVGPHQSHPYLGINVNVNFNVTQSHSDGFKYEKAPVEYPSLASGAPVMWKICKQLTGEGRSPGEGIGCLYQ